MSLALINTDNMFLVVVLFILGIGLIVKGGDFFVDASSWIAEKSGIPKFIIGATIVSIATTLPELLVSAIGAAEGSVGMSVGNAVGSVTANTGLIMGISIFFMPVIIDRKNYMFKSIMLMVATLLIWLFSLGGSFNVWSAVILLVILVAFIVENVMVGKKEAQKANEIDVLEEQPVVKEKAKGEEVFINIAKFIGGAAGIVLGAQLLVDEGTVIARALNVSEAVIGLTMVAIGTSLPELVTTITAIVKKESSLSIGNIIGANLIDICLILPVCSFIYGGSLPIESRSIRLDMPVCLGLILIALIPTLIRGKLNKFQGLLMILLYIAYAIVISVVTF